MVAVQTAGPVLSCWLAADSESLLCLTRAGLYRAGVAVGAGELQLVRAFSQPALACCARKDKLAVLLQLPGPGVRLLELAGWEWREVWSQDCLNLPSPLEQPIWLAAPPLGKVSAHSYTARLGEVTVEFSKKASPSVRSGATFRTRGQWLAAGLADVRAAPCLVTSLAGSLTLLSRDLTCNILQSSVLDIVSLSPSAFLLLTEDGDLWRVEQEDSQQCRLLQPRVRALSQLSNRVTVVTWDGAVYRLAGPSQQPGLVPVPAATVERLVEQNKLLDGVEKEANVASERLEQLRLYQQFMTWGAAQLEQLCAVQASLCPGPGLENRQLEIGCNNTSSTSLADQFWYLKFEVELGGRVNCSSVNMPAWCREGNQLSCRLPLPPALPSQFPLRLTTKLCLAAGLTTSLCGSRPLPPVLLGTTHIPGVAALTLLGTGLGEMQLQGAGGERAWAACARENLVWHTEKITLARRVLNQSGLGSRLAGDQETTWGFYSSVIKIRVVDGGEAGQVVVTLQTRDRELASFVRRELQRL